MIEIERFASHATVFLGEHLIDAVLDIRVWLGRVFLADNDVAHVVSSGAQWLNSVVVSADVLYWGLSRVPAFQSLSHNVGWIQCVSAYLKASFYLRLLGSIYVHLVRDVERSVRILSTDVLNMVDIWCARVTSAMQTHSRLFHITLALAPLIFFDPVHMDFVQHVNGTCQLVCLHFVLLLSCPNV